MTLRYYLGQVDPRAGQVFTPRVLWLDYLDDIENILQAGKSLEHKATDLLKLWALLHCRDIWYELIAPTLQLRLNLGRDAPNWLLSIAENKLKFSSALRILSCYSLVDVKE